MFVLLMIMLEIFSSAIVKSQENCTNFTCEEIPTCREGYSAILNKCFMVLNATELNWEESKEECANNSGTLAIINDCNLMHPLSIFLNDSGTDTDVIWIGASDSEAEGTWTWVDGSDVLMGNPFWGTESIVCTQPNGGIEENCAIMNRTDQYHFHDHTCSTFGTALCQSEPLNLTVTENCKCNDVFNITCPEEFVSVGGSCFYFPRGPNGTFFTRNYEDSKSLCRTVHPKADLPIIESCELFRELVIYIDSKASYDANGLYWVNAYRNDEGVFFWGNGNEVQLGSPFWGMGEPDNDLERCIVMIGPDNYYFHDTHCNVTFHFPLCQAEPLPHAS